MKVPFSWLKDYVDIKCTPEELQTKLFSCGFEVEEMVRPYQNIDRIVSCKIIEIEKHPNADKLSVTKVDAGKYGILQIVTAAKNIFTGAVVPVALDNSTLFNGEKIKTGKLRGVLSQGMFCSGEELGITDDYYMGASVNGILILDNNFPLGENLTDLLDLNEVMFDINVTANRPDCQSILGIAREVAAVLNLPLKMPDLSYKCDNNVSSLKTVKVENNAFDLCQRYKAHYVKDIVIEQSPLWLKRRLFSMGIRSINNIVDITNYVLLEIGQPMHAFDLNELEDNTINVRRAIDGEKIITLDEKEFVLSTDNLVICDKVKPVALAGVMGGLNSGIKDTTTEILFESARFSRDNIRKTSRNVGQRSDSSARFEKGIDYLSVELGMQRALNLIDTLKCGKIACDEYDLIDKPLTNKVIDTTFTKINGVLGISIPNDFIVDTLKKLYFDVVVNGDNIKVTVPLFREDMESYPDIAEEIIREYGYDQIDSTLLKTCEITNGGLNYYQDKKENLKNVMAGFGFNEIITYSFVPEKDFELFNFGISKDKIVKILNPISEDLAVMRVSLVPSILRAVGYNLSRKNNNGRLFEIAKSYISNGNELPQENDNLAFAIFGDEDFFSLKGVVEGVLGYFTADSKINYVNSKVNYMHPTRSADIIINNKNVGYFGQIHPEIADKFDIDKPVYVCEIYYDKLAEFENNKLFVKSISKFPSVERDLAIVVDENVSCSKIIDVIKESAGELLENVSLFDVYRGEHISADKKSMAFNMVFVSTERTLGVEEIDTIIKNVLKVLKEQLNAELR